MPLRAEYPDYGMPDERPHVESVTLPTSGVQLASGNCSPSWCDKCQTVSIGHMHRSGIYVPGCQHDSKERRLWQLLKDIEMHCPCGARPESPNTHPHVGGCPVDEALRLMTPNADLRQDADSNEISPRIGSAFWDSPALKSLSKHYPERFGGRVPMRIKMLMNVRPYPCCVAIGQSGGPGTILRYDETYECWTNSHGAVAGICANGFKLGVKPDEFEVVEWYMPNDQALRPAR